MAASARTFITKKDYIGLDITITTTAKTDEEGRALLESFNFPFRTQAHK